MTWVKLDDTCPDHPAIVGLSDAAFACWVRSLCYSSRHLTDGFVPRSAIRTLGTPKAAKELVASGRWEQAEGGVRIHGYEEKQRTRAEVEAERAQWRERQSRHRKVTPESRRDASVSHGGVTRPEVEAEAEVETDPSKSSLRARAVDARERQQRIDEACRQVARRRADDRPDVGPAWAPAAARGLASDHHQTLHAHLADHPEATTDDLVALIEGGRPQEPPNRWSHERRVSEILAELPPRDDEANRAGIAEAKRQLHPTREAG